MELIAAVEQLAGTQVEIREISGRYATVPVDRALLDSPVWRALRTGPRGGAGRSPVEALALLAFAACVVAGGARRPAAPRAADAWLRQALQDAPQGAGGGVPVSDVVRAARAAGIGPTALRRAAARLGVVRTKTSMRGGWSWSLPAASEAQAEAAAAASEGGHGGFEESAGAAGEGQSA